MTNLFQKIECFLGLHKMEVKEDKRKFSTVHYRQCLYCDHKEIIDDSECNCLPKINSVGDINV